MEEKNLLLICLEIAPYDGVPCSCGVFRGKSAGLQHMNLLNLSAYQLIVDLQWITPIDFPDLNIELMETKLNAIERMFPPVVAVQRGRKTKKSL